MVKVYIATEGSRADYRILGVFASLEEAKKVGDDWEEMELWKTCPAPRIAYDIVDNRWPANPKIRVFRVYPWDDDYGTIGPRPVERDLGYKGSSIRFVGGDRDAVLRSYHDRRTQWLADERTHY